jgi:hypothetical protein
MFQKILLAIACLCVTFGSQQAKADVYVHGYVRSNGTHVAPHFRSNPDHSFYNNWSTFPNINPYTGRMGARLTPSYVPRMSLPSYHVPSIFPGGYGPYGWPR